jgi:RimJ/RimL family protein N-acetyltransferase
VFDSFSLIAELEIPGPSDVKTTEVGLFYAVHPDHRSMGYATEATHALIEYGWSVLNLRRVVATTSYDNHPSIRVMEKCGMRICRNPFPDPEWLQIVAYVNHPNTDQNSQRIQ